jgi:hypothetical protein
MSLKTLKKVTLLNKNPTKPRRKIIKIGNIVLKNNLLICTFSNRKNNPRIKT